MASLGLADVNASFRTIFGAESAWFEDWKLWIGGTLWFAVLFRWLRHGYNGLYWVKAAFTAGLNLTILSSVQHFGEAGVYLSCAAVVLQTIVSTYVFWKPSDAWEKKQFCARSLYEDIGGPCLQAVFLFVGQFSLILLYFCALFRGLDSSTRNYTHWVLAYFAVQMSAFFNRGANSQLGQVWNGSLWLTVLRSTRKAKFSCTVFGGDERYFQVSYAEMLARGFMGFVVNNLFREAMAFTIPIMLMVLSDPFEFIGSCLALNFVVTLDDMDAKEYKVHAEDLSHAKQPPALSFQPATPPAKPSNSCSCCDELRDPHPLPQSKLLRALSSYSCTDSSSRTVVPGELESKQEPEELV